MFYTYILECLNDTSQHYVGHTSDLRQRLQNHNDGLVTSTAKFRPWKVKTYIAFDCIEKARTFERYLKSGSGRAFRTRHF